MKLHIMQFPSDCGYFLPVRSKHALQHPVLKQPKACILHLMQETKFHTHIEHQE
jgi:hypothetical protein